MKKKDYLEIEALFKKLPLAKKAYSIDNYIINDPQSASWFGDENIVYCENRNEAKKELLKIAEECEATDRYSKPFNYLNIPVKRNKDFDKRLYKEKSYSIDEFYKVIYKEEKLEELDEIKNNPNISHCYIYKNGFLQ